MRAFLPRSWRRRSRTPFVADLREDPENPDNWYGLEYVHDRITAQLHEQSRAWEEADGRLRLILGVIGVVFAATLGLLPRGTITVSTASGPAQQLLLLPTWVGALAVGSLGLYAVAAIVAAVAYWPRAFTLPPAPDALRQYVTTDEREIKLLVVDEMLDAYAANGVWLGRKVGLFRYAFVISTAATGLLGLSVMLEVLQLTRALGT